MAIRIVVVDNDIAESARNVVKRYATMSEVPIHYETEPVQNIALARTRALTACSGDYVAFIDSDDEEATPKWLQHLLDAIRDFRQTWYLGQYFRSIKRPGMIAAWSFLNETAGTPAYLSPPWCNK